MDKQRILDEIRRTTADNGGVPLGVRQFTAQTGIKEFDWRGRYWARWGDAVREAGFTPNTITRKTDEDVLLAQVGAFVRELGRFPTVAEMRIRKRQDDRFPNHKVLDRRGSRRELIGRLANFCRRTDGWADVATLCGSMLDAEPAEAEVNGSASQTAHGFVYLALMRVGREKRYKIGKANLLEQRTRQIAVTLPEELELIHAIRTDDPYGIEAYWHSRFAEKRRSGEWFALAPEDVKAFRLRKFM